MTQLIDGDKIEGTYKITENGEHCVDIGGKSNCATIEDSGDGAYERVITKNGKRAITWKSFTDGNQL